MRVVFAVALFVACDPVVVQEPAVAHRNSCAVPTCDAANACAVLVAWCGPWEKPDGCDKVAAACGAGDACEACELAALAAGNFDRLGEALAICFAGGCGEGVCGPIDLTSGGEGESTGC